jgi:hypothetical protein
MRTTAKKTRKPVYEPVLKLPALRAIPRAEQPFFERRKSQCNSKRKSQSHFRIGQNTTW